MLDNQSDVLKLNDKNLLYRAAVSEYSHQISVVKKCHTGEIMPPVLQERSTPFGKNDDKKDESKSKKDEFDRASIGSKKTEFTKE